MKMEDTAGADGATRRRSSATSANAGPKVATVSARYLNRELSMLDYHSPVLARAEYHRLAPLAVVPGHPFTYISNFSSNLGVMIRDPLLRQERFARIKVPPLLPRYVALSGDRFVAIEEVIAHNLSSLFAGMEIVSHGLFRVTRDNDLEVREAEADDLLLAIQSELRRHRRRASAVRLEVNPDVPADVLDLLVRELELKPEDVHHEKGTLDLASAANFLADLDQPQLKLR